MRIRTIKPSFWTSATTTSVSRDARLTFIGLWNEADDEGRLLGSPKRLSGVLFPNDDDVDVRLMSEWLEELGAAGLIVRYEVRGVSYIAIPGFVEHQKIDKRVSSRFPPPPAGLLAGPADFPPTPAEDSEEPADFPPNSVRMTTLEQALKRMAAAIANQDNACTVDPIFTVQRHRRVYGFDPAYSDKVVYMNHDNDYVEVDLKMAPRCPRCAHVYTVAQINADDGIATCPGCSASLSDDECTKIIRDYEDSLKCPECEEVLSADEVECESCDKCDSSFDIGDDLSLTKTAYQDTWEHVQAFFTRQGAEDYLAINGHNLRDREPPRIYVDSAFRNAEWQAVRAMLMTLATECE